MVGARRRAREIALQVLIQLDVSPEMTAADGIRLFFDHLVPDGALEDRGDDELWPDDGEGGGAAYDKALVDDLVKGTAARKAEIDDVVQGLSRNWRIERMALVERNIIRLAVYEMKFAAAQIPTNVTLNEAIELAKRFGTSEGSAFVNGLLDRAATELQVRR